jgi:plastocyanin
VRAILNRSGPRRVWTDMKKTRLAIALALTSALAVVPAYAARSAATLLGSVGPGFEISLKNAKNLKPGTYKLSVNDKATSHNFHLKGPGVNVTTSVGGKGVKTFTVALKRGTYTFVCDPHASSMKGSFRVR